MAKEKMNKSQMIRDAIAANKKMTPTEIAAMLNEKHNLKISGQYVSTIKSNAAKKRRGRRGGRKAMASGSGNGFSAIGTALEFVKAAGGIEQAKEALGAIEQIASVVR